MAVAFGSGEVQILHFANELIDIGVTAFKQRHPNWFLPEVFNEAAAILWNQGNGAGAHELGDPNKAVITKLVGYPTKPTQQFGSSMLGGFYRSTKTFGHELGLSSCFRQWRAYSHCNQLHGYALSFTLTFEAKHLDDRNWVMDFGGLKPVKKFLVEQFDHALLVALDDPRKVEFERLRDAGLATVNFVPAVGCEAFAKCVAAFVKRWLEQGAPDVDGQVYDITIASRVRLVSVECHEHGANSATYIV